MNKTYCDRCGEEIPSSLLSGAFKPFNLVATGSGLSPVLDNVDICPECLKLLKHWFDHPDLVQYLYDDLWLSEKECREAENDF